MISRFTLETIKELYCEENTHFPPVNAIERFSLRSIMFDVIGDELIPVKLFSPCASFSLATYDKNGKGYKGIAFEVKKRLQFATDTGIEGLPLKDFFKHSNKESDLYDEENGTDTEFKSGCGNWFYSSHKDLDKIREEKIKSGELINWKYHYTRKKESEFSFTIVINTDWYHFFRYLDEYPLGYKTFFKYNEIQSLKSNCNVFEMNTLKTSKKKVRFLRAFKEID